MTVWGKMVPVSGESLGKLKMVVSSAQEWCSDRALLLLYEAKRKMAPILPTGFVILVTHQGYNSKYRRGLNS